MWYSCPSSHLNFYPRPPRGGRHKDGTMTIMASKFLSTPSARRATASDTQIIIRDVISIHALREEGDTPSAPSSRARPNFYPRPPRGGRLTVDGICGPAS